MTMPEAVRLLRAVVLVGLLVEATSTGASAQGSAPVRPPAQPSRAEAPKPDPALEAARIAFEALPEAERRAMQEALVWTGRYASVATGSFGRRTYDALVARQRAAGVPPTGILSDKERMALLAEGRRAREAAGFTVRTDAATGVALGIPGKLLPREQKLPQGTRWQSADGRVTLETRAFAPGETDLQATFDRVSAATPERKVTYKLKRPDFVVVTGETPGGRFYIRYADTPAGLRGFTLGYDKALGPEIERVVIAVANSFEPVAQSRPTPPSSPAAVAVRPAVPRPDAHVATALLVAPHRLLIAASALTDCAAPKVEGVPARVIATDVQAGLALLEGVDATGTSLALGAAPEAGAPLAAVAMEPTGAVIVPADAAPSGRVVAPLQPGATGAPVFDRAGHLVGVVAAYPSVPTRVAGIVPPIAHALVSGSTVSAFLAGQGIAPAREVSADARSTGEIAAKIAPALRALICD